MCTRCYNITHTVLWRSAKSASEWAVVAHSKKIGTTMSESFETTTVKVYAVLAVREFNMYYMNR